MNWICPHCGIAQVVTSAACDTKTLDLHVGIFAEVVRRIDREPALRLFGNAIACANEICRKTTVQVSLLSSSYSLGSDYHSEVDQSVFFSAQIYPGRLGKPFPVGVPEHFLDDYNEAWSIIDLSPKSSATLARRCLQGMIRDFCGIREKNLWLEIKTLESRLADEKLPRGVDQDTVAAMRAVKDIGNIGAHMEEIDGKIVDVDPDEAATLLGLIEMLFADWYVARAKREQRLAAIVAVKQAKLPNKY